MKFGGTSVATTELMDRIAHRVSGLRNEGHEVVLVVSAMGHETDRLVDLADQVDYQDPAGRQELDVLLSTGEQVSIALLAMSPMKAGISARSYQGHQIPIHTDAAYSRLDAGQVVNHVAQQVGGKGGGRKDLARAGGDQVDELDGALESVVGFVEKALV